MRVEALATPSEHIPALMERVKPIYLSRTYGIPLPNPDDPSENWDPETLLDKLARMKGRLLKGGEPALDSVAKIILTDWVRGRIPYFVTPPERPESLNVAEARAASRADAKGKGKAVDNGETKERVLGVKQNLGSIMQKNTFVGEDIKSLEEVGAGVDHASEAGSNEADIEDAQDAENVGEEDLAWNDVFPGDGEAKPPQNEEVQTVFSKAADDGTDGDEDEDATDEKGTPYLTLHCKVLC